MQGIYLNYIGSAGGTFAENDRFTVDNPHAATAFEYLVTLINTDRVAPPASATNDNGDFSPQRVYLDYWAGKGVDVAPFFDVLDGPRIVAPGGTGFAAGFQAIRPYFDEMFLGRLPVKSALAQAQEAANTAAQR